MKKQSDELSFIWDPEAITKKNSHIPQKNRQATVRSFEDYLDFIDQFDNPHHKKGADLHVDKVFTLF